MSVEEFIFHVKCARSAAELDRLLHIEFPHVRCTPEENARCVATVHSRLDHFTATEEGALVHRGFDFDKMFAHAA